MSTTSNPCANITTCQEKRACIKAQLATAQDAFQREVSTYLALQNYIDEQITLILGIYSGAGLIIGQRFRNIIDAINFLKNFDANLQNAQDALKTSKAKLLTIGQQINNLCNQLENLIC